MREIGSEFWEVPVIEKQNTLLLESTQWFLSGRSALQAIIADLGEARSVALPSWCCDSMIKPFADAGYSIKFYPVIIENGELMQKVKMDADVLFLMDYFGYTGLQHDMSGYNGVVIRDVTHSIFSTTYSDSDFYFGSLRKWCGLWTGGYAWAKDGHQLPREKKENYDYTILREKAMEQKSSYIHGWGVTDKEYLRVFDEAEEVLEKVGIEPAADRDVMLAKKLDVEFIKERRRANAEVLRNAFPDWLIFPEMKENNCPMFVPVLIPDGKRDALRCHLIQNEIYCPIHWPVSEYHQLDTRTVHIYQNELSLVCDQRYTEEDMNRMVETIKSFMEG